MTASTEPFGTVGSSIFISAALPATFDVTGYDALTWIEIDEVDDIPEYGSDSSVITRTPLKDGITRKRKGAANFGSFAPNGALVEGDPGQAAVKNAAKPSSKAPVAIKVLKADGSIDYMRALITSFKTNIGNSENTTSMSFNVEIDGEILTKAPA